MATAVMRMTSLGRLLALAAAVAVALPAQAALVSVPTSFGPDTGTLDTTTGLVFLDMDRTTGRSYNTIQSQLGPGGTFAGFWYATVSEVLTLFDSSGVAIRPSITSAEQATFFSVFSAMMSISPVDVGGSGEILAYRGLTGNLATEAISPARRIAEIVIDPITTANPPGSIFTATSGFLVDTQIPMVFGTLPPGAGVRAAGSWLVIPTATPVPAPSVLWLVTTGLAALGLRRRAGMG